MPMKFPAKSGGADFAPVPAGTHIAVCDIVADLGVQPGSALYPAAKRQVYLRFELPNERIDFEKDGKKQNGPAVIGKTYTASMNEKANLRKDLENWRGQAFSDIEAEQFDVASVLGKPCVIGVTHSQKGDKIYANITSIGRLMKGVNPKSIIPEIAPLLYSEDSQASYKQLPEWLQKKIDGQIVPEKSKQQEADPDSDAYQDGSYDPEITDDDIPF